MKTLLVVAEHPGLADSLRAALATFPYKIVHRSGVAEAEPMLAHGLADLCILDLELARVQALWVLERVHVLAPGCPLIVFTGSGPQEWEEEAYLKGAAHVLAKPVRPRMLSALLERLTRQPARAIPAAGTSGSVPGTPGVSIGYDTQHLTASSASTTATAHTLSVLRDFSGILSHSLDADGMMKEFLLLLREILGVNRAAIFLRSGMTTPTTGSSEAHRLRAVSAIGLSQSLLQHLELSLEAGIGGQVMRSGRILRRNSPETASDVEAHKEFELLGAQVAVPVLDRETVIGVAVFDGRITGEPLLNAELELVFHLLEQVGLAVRNTWLHAQLSANNSMLGDILRELSSACIVIGSELSILHANKVARKHFGSSSEARSGELEFTDLPQMLGTRVYQVLKNGSGISNLRYEPEHLPGTVFRVSIVPFQRQGGGLPSSALLIAEDISHSEQMRALEVENASLRLIQAMAPQMAAEIGNAIMPVSVVEQTMLSRWKEPGFRERVQDELALSVKRVNRLLAQLRILGRSGTPREPIVLPDVLLEAYNDASQFQEKQAARLDAEKPQGLIRISGSKTELKHALSEVLLNALQSADKEHPKVAVHYKMPSNGDKPSVVQIEVEDNGPGFTPETARQATQPFYTNRIPGVGLGLTITQRVIENHGGRLELVPGKTGLVRISLPLESTSGAITAQP